MKNTVTTLSAMLLACALLTGGPLLAQKKKAVKMPSQDEIMKRWQAFMTPGPEHKELASCAGTWSAEINVWMAGPGSEAQTSTGTAEFSTVLGGRYLKQEVSATMMGMPFNGIGYTGYDNFKKKFVGSWMDDMGTGLTTMEGTADASGKSITMWGVMDEPTTGERNKKVKYITKIVDADTQVFEIYDVTTYGEKAPIMQMTYKRKK
jgi:hypothetical protein